MEAGRDDVDVVCRKIDAELAEDLDEVRVEWDGLTVRDRADLLEVVDAAELVVRGHDRDNARVVADPVGDETHRDTARRARREICYFREATRLKRFATFDD